MAAKETEPLTPETTILRALHAVMEDVEYVQKSGENDFHGYTYATEADVLKRLRPAMIKHGLVLIPSVQQVSNIDANGVTTVTMQYTLAHTSGAVWPTPIFAAGSGGDRSKSGIGDKGLYKALTGANKYLLFKLFQIEIGDDPEQPKVDYDRDDAAKQEREDRKARQFYLEGGKLAISRQETVKELEDWWASEEDNRSRAGVVKGTAEFDDLQKAAKNRKYDIIGEDRKRSR